MFVKQTFSAGVKKGAIRAENMAEGAFLPVSSLPQREPIEPLSEYREEPPKDFHVIGGYVVRWQNYSHFSDTLYSIQQKSERKEFESYCVLGEDWKYFEFEAER